MIPIDQEQVRLLERRLRGIGVDRRSFLKIAAAASAGPLAASLLAACGGDDDDDATATTDESGQAATEAPTESSDEETSTEEPTEESSTSATETETSSTPEPEPTETAAGQVELTDEQILFDWGLSADPASNDFNADLYSGGVAHIWAGLGTFDPDFTAVGDWAESWEPNDDATVWTFNIRKDNTGFSNGDPVTAEVFAWSWKRMLIPETAAPYASILYDIKNAEAVNLEGMDPEELGVTVVDDWTLDVEMVGPRGLFPIIVSYVAAVPAHQASVEANPDTWTDPSATGEPVVSNGPFYLTEWQHDVSLTAVKNENYWDAPNVSLETVVDPIIPNEQGLLPYETGELDWALVPGPDLQRVRDDSTLSAELVRYVYPGIWFLLPQVTIAPFDQLEVRQAVSQSIDRDRQVTVTNGQSQPAFSLMPPGLFGYFDDEEITSIMAYDPDAAMAHLEGTEYEGGENWPEITLSLREEAHNSQIMAEDIAAQLKENLNMDIAIEIMEARTFRAALWEGSLQFIFIRWFYDYPDPNNGYFDMFYSNKDTGKRQEWSNAEFDDLTIQGKEEPDPDARLAIYRQAELIMQDEVAYVPTTYQIRFYVFKPWVQGLPINKQGFIVPDGNIFVRMLNAVHIEGKEG